MPSSRMLVKSPASQNQYHRKSRSFPSGRVPNHRKLENPHAFKRNSAINFQEICKNSSLSLKKRKDSSPYLEEFSSKQQPPRELEEGLKFAVRNLTPQNGRRLFKVSKIKDLRKYPFPFLLICSDLDK